MEYTISIAGVVLRMETEQQLPMTDAFRPFLTNETPDYTARFRCVEALGQMDDRVIFEESCYRVHPDGSRSFFDAPQDPAAYALARTMHDRALVQIDYLADGARCVSRMENSFFHLGFEGLLIRRDRVCFHAACIRTAWGGILFSGPSGIGKSTQAELWCRHRGAELVNGDRPVLHRRDDGFLAWGSPYAGSSRCHVNTSVPVKALVFLAQEPENRIRRLGAGEAFRRIYAGLTIHPWDREFMERAVALAAELAAAVPCYELGCVPDETAVACLEQRLEQDCRRHPEATA